MTHADRMTEIVVGLQLFLAESNLDSDEYDRLNLIYEKAESLCAELDARPAKTAKKGAR